MLPCVHLKDDESPWVDPKYEKIKPISRDVDLRSLGYPSTGASLLIEQGVHLPILGPHTGDH